MKSIKVIVIGLILAIALVACPIEDTRDITAGLGFILGAVLAAWLGVRQRKGARKGYEDAVRRYTGTTTMKVVGIEESVDERWGSQEDGSDRLRRETFYLPTITENRPRKPVFGGALLFALAAFLLWFGIMTFTGQVSIS